MEGTLKAQMLTEGEAVRQRLADSPDALIRQLLQEEHRPMSAENICEVLVELNVPRPAATKAVAKAEPGLRKDPRIVYEPEGRVEQFAWSDADVPVDPDAFFRSAGWLRVLEAVAAGVDKRQLDVLRERAQDDWQLTDLVRIALAALDVLPWPDVSDVRRLSARSGMAQDLKTLPGGLLGRIQEAAVAAKRADVLLLLVRTEGGSKVLQGLGDQIEAAEPAPELIMVTLHALRADLSGDRSTVLQRAAAIRRLPRIRATEHLEAAMNLLAVFKNDREFEALAGRLDADALEALPEETWLEVTSRVRKGDRERLAKVVQSEALRNRLDPAAGQE